MKNIDPRLKISAQRLKMLREEQGWSQEDLAIKMGTEKSLISYYESCQRSPGYNSILKLKEIFNESADYIMGDSSARKLKKIAN